MSMMDKDINNDDRNAGREREVEMHNDSDLSAFLIKLDDKGRNLRTRTIANEALSTRVE